MSIIAIAAESGSDLNAKLDPRFGRAAYFLIVDTEKGTLLEAVNNSNVEAAHGAGTGSAALMGEKKAEAVIAGLFGPKAFDTLKALGINAYIGAKGSTAAEALQAYNQGKLEKFEYKVY
jgi:predicted Fe-Mo cluster-binding NifX family protein